MFAIKMSYGERFNRTKVYEASYPYRPSQPVRPNPSWTAPSSYRPNPYKWVNPSVRSCSDQYKADLQPVRCEQKPVPSYSATYSSRPADRASPMERYRSAAPARLQRADRSGRAAESRRYKERSRDSRFKYGSHPPKGLRGEFIVLDVYSSESDTSLATSSGSGSSLASSSETGSDTSLSQSSSGSSTVLSSTGSESSLDDDSDCSVAAPDVEAHEHKETPELWGTHMTDDMKRQLESWASEKPEDFVPVTPNLRGNSDKGRLSLTSVQSASKPIMQSSVVAKQQVTCAPKPIMQSSVVAKQQVTCAPKPIMQSSVVAKQEVSCAHKPCIQSSVVARLVVMPTQPALQSSVSAWTTPVQRIIPDHSCSGCQL